MSGDCELVEAADAIETDFQALHVFYREAAILKTESAIMAELARKKWLTSGDTEFDVSRVISVLKSGNQNLVQLGSEDYLRPLSHSEARSLTLSAQFGLGPQPLHTDGAHRPTPPRYILLECVESGRRPCGTNILVPDFAALVAMKPRALVHPGWVARRSTSRSFYCHVLECPNSTTSYVRFDLGCMTNPSLHSAHLEALHLLERGAAKASIFLKKGEWLLIDNWVVLHGRAEGAHLARSRIMKRTQWGNDELVTQ